MLLVSMIRNDVKLLKLPIGGMMSLCNAPMFSDKLIALKQNNKTLLLLYHEASPSVCIVDDCMHNVSIYN